MCKPPWPQPRGAPARRPKIHTPGVPTSERVGFVLPSTVASGLTVVNFISVGDAPRDAVDVAGLERMLHCCTGLSSALVLIIVSSAGHRPGLVSLSAILRSDVTRPTLEIVCLLCASRAAATSMSRPFLVVCVARVITEDVCFESVSITRGKGSL